MQFSDQSFVPVSTPKPVEIPQVQFLDKLFTHVVVSGADGQTAQITVEIPQMQFLDEVHMPVVLHDSALVQICRKLWSSTVAVSDEVGMPVVVQR